MHKGPTTLVWPVNLHLHLSSADAYVQLLLVKINIYIIKSKS